MSDPGVVSPAPPPADDDPRASLKAGLLIAAAVLIGFVLLLKGFSQEGGIVDTTSSKADQAGESTTTTLAALGGVDETTTTTLGAGKSPAEVTVMVANASGLPGVAGTMATRLKTGGYTKVDTTNAAMSKTSAVYYAQGAQAEAMAVAKSLGVEDTAVAAMPASPPADPKGAQVLVVVGSDKA